MKNKTIGIAMGVICILMVAPQLGRSIPSFRGFPLTEPARWVFALGGVVIILYNLFYKRSKSHSNISFYEDTICPKCEETFVKSAPIPDSLCPKCKVQLEPLEGFYDRHPELKNEDEDLPEKIEDIK